VRLHDSAGKHFERDRLTVVDVLHAGSHVAYRAPLDDEDDPRRWLLLGFDEAARLLEIVVLIFDSGEQLVIHAMKARPQHVDLLR
jgi:hypothetical protein